MKKSTPFVLILVFFLLSCHRTNETAIPIDECKEKTDSLSMLKIENDSITLKLTLYSDSIVVLNSEISNLKQKPLMSETQFIQIYKYETLLKYYNICKRNPTQWKFYRGWSTRIFEQN